MESSGLPRRESEAGCPRPRGCPAEAPPTSCGLVGRARAPPWMDAGERSLGVGWVAPGLLVFCAFLQLSSLLLPVPLLNPAVRDPRTCRAHPALRARNPGLWAEAGALKACATGQGSLFQSEVRFNHICCLCSLLGRLLGFPKSLSMWLAVLSRHKLSERMSHAYFKGHILWSLQ